MSGALQRLLHRTAKVIGTGAVVGAAHIAGLGPVGTAIAESGSTAIGGTVADAVSGSIHRGGGQESSSSSFSSSGQPVNVVTPGTGVSAGGSTVYPSKALHQAPVGSGQPNAVIPGGRTSGGSSSSTSGPGANMLGLFVLRWRTRCLPR